MTGTRPHPDVVLRLTTNRERDETRGKLTIYLGYAAGVGKTYAMLEASRRRVLEGIDLVLGWVESHGRAETDALCLGLETIPRRRVEYRGISLEELDVDAVIARHPRIVVVDELAHTNVPGSRHEKRWNSVDEIRAAGIDVYTTLNIQHVESLRGVVERITGVRIQETVPDLVLDDADEIRVVDLPPDELRQRLREGKVYLPDQARNAIARFFRSGNLLALRELALRAAARRVDAQMRAYMQVRAIDGPWAASERILVSVSGSPFSADLIRETRRLADEVGADWFAAYVETADADRLSRENRERIHAVLALAERLGAKIVTLSGSSVPEAVLEFARANNVTKLVTGRTRRARWMPWRRASVVDVFIDRGAPIDVVVVGAGEVAGSEDAEKKPSRSVARASKYAKAVLLVAAATAVGLPFVDRLAPTNLVMAYLVAVVIAAIDSGRGPSLLAAVLSVACLNFFFVPPRFTFVVSDTQYVITFLALLLVGVVISTLVARAREREEAAKRHSAETALLLDLSRELAQRATGEEIAEVLESHATRVSRLKAKIYYAGESAEAVEPARAALENNDQAALMWCVANGRPAGSGTSTLPSARCFFLPIPVTSEPRAALALEAEGGRSVALLPDRLGLIEALCAQTALALDRVHLTARAQRTSALEQAERLHRAVLNSVSHDIRTPLSSVLGAVSGLRDTEGVLDSHARTTLVETAWREGRRLDRVVGNLLDMSRLDAGALALRPMATDPADLIGAAIAQVADVGARARIRVEHGLPALALDPKLMTQALANVIENAVKHAPGSSPIEISAFRRDRALVLSVRDHGPGVPEADRERIFDKFYRVANSDSTSGTGLGLAIARGIAEAHGGRLRALWPSGGQGALFEFEVPLDDDSPGAVVSS